MAARVTATLALFLFALVACNPSPTPVSTPAPTPIPADPVATSLEAMRAADAALINALTANNDAFVDAAAASDSFAHELDALNSYASTLHIALEAYGFALETALDSYAAAVQELKETVNYDVFDIYQTSLPALIAMLMVRELAYETYDSAREDGYQGIRDAAHDATGEFERRAALEAFQENNPALLAASKAFDAAIEAVDVAKEGLTDAMDQLEVRPSRHGADYATAVLAALEAVDQEAAEEAAEEAARVAYTTSARAAFDAAFHLMQAQYSTAIASVPVPMPTPTPATKLTSPQAQFPSKVSRQGLYSSLTGMGIRLLPLNKHDTEYYSTMSPNGDISFDIFGSSSRVEAVELWYRESVSRSTIVRIVETLINSLVPAYRAEGLQWFEGAMNRAGKHQTHLGGMYLTSYCCDDILRRAFFSVDADKS